MRILITIVALVVAFPSFAAEDSNGSGKSESENLGRLFESLLGSVAHELGEVAERIEPEQPLDRTLAIRVEVEGHGPVSILCATTRFSIESEHLGAEHQVEVGDQREESQESALELTGVISETDEYGEYLIRYAGEFVYETRLVNSGDERHMEETDDGRLEFEGSAIFSVGSERVLARKDDRHILLIVEEAE